MIGIDMVEIERIKSAAESRHFVKRVFTETETAYCLNGGGASSLAGAWCVKEAVAKALGTGLKFPLTAISVEHDALGKPRAVLSDWAKKALGERKVEISVTHTDSVCAAVAVIMP